MKFYRKSKKTPKVGDKQAIKRFAWFPVAINYKLTVWLECYYEIWEYVEEGPETWRVRITRTEKEA